MFRHSLFYRWLGSSLTLGWLFSVPDEEQKNYIRSSYTYRLSSKVIDVILDKLYKMGDTLKNLGQGSIAGQDLPGFLGILVFFYFILDLTLNDYSLRRTILELILAAAGLGTPVIRKAPGIWQGSLILSFFRWWQISD